MRTQGVRGNYSTQESIPFLPYLTPLSPSLSGNSFDPDRPDSPHYLPNSPRYPPAAGSRTAARVSVASASAADAFGMISSRDLSEIKALKTPPEPIRILMEVLCLLLDITPVKKQDKMNSRWSLDYWEPARKHIFCDPMISMKVVFFRGDCTWEDAAGS